MQQPLPAPLSRPHRRAVCAANGFAARKPPHASNARVTVSASHEPPAASSSRWTRRTPRPGQGRRALCPSPPQRQGGACDARARLVTRAFPRRRDTLERSPIDNLDIPGRVRGSRLEKLSNENLLAAISASTPGRAAPRGGTAGGGGPPGSRNSRWRSRDQAVTPALPSDVRAFAAGGPPHLGQDGQGSS